MYNKYIMTLSDIHMTYIELLPGLCTNVSNCLPLMLYNVKGLISLNSPPGHE